MTDQAATARNAPAAGVAFIVVGILAISVNDMLIKKLSGDYPLHEMVFARSAIGICFSLAMVQFEGGFRILRTRTPGLHMLRGLLVVVSNMCYFAALAVMPLATASATFFVAPLLITLFSIPFLGERVGYRRISAVVLGFAGVLAMQQPWAALPAGGPGRVAMLLPLAAAVTYALMQILTRRLGIASKASALAVYIQATFIVVSLGFFLVAGDGRFAVGVENQSLVFLLRAWRWPSHDDLYVFLFLGANSAVIGYCLSQAYRMADAATVAPFEYIELPLAIMWGWVMFGDLPNAQVTAGIALIMGSGIYVFARERRRHHPVASKRPVRKW